MLHQVWEPTRSHFEPVFRGKLTSIVSTSLLPQQRAFFISMDEPGRFPFRSLSLNMLRRIPFEALIWVTALLILAFAGTGPGHFTLCPLKNAGFTFCPGCGLGSSVSFLLHGEFTASLQSHPLGFFAVIVLSFRIINLTKLYIQNYGKSY